VRPDLHAIWEQYAAVVAEHDEWPIAAAYLRESKREQAEGFSPSAQLKGTLEEAARRRLWIPASHVFLDLMSGRREDRAQFQDVLALARSGAISAVIVLHTSRWARNALVSRKYKEELRRRGVDVLAINAPFDIARPEGRFAERLVEAADEFHSDTIGFWVTVGLREKHERGEPLGLLPETFMRDDASRVVPHPALSALVLEGARRYVSGQIGFGDLAKWADRDGHRTPSGRHLTDEWWRNVLANPLNAGYVGYRRKKGGKELRRASFDGFLPLDLFQAVQEVKARRSRRHHGGRPTPQVYALSGATCGECGGRFTAASQRRMRCRSAAEHAGCAQGSVPAEIIEAQFRSDVLAYLDLPSDQRARLASLVRAKLAKGSDAAKASRLRAAIRRLTDAFTWGGIEDEDYRAELRRLRADLDGVTRLPDEHRILEAVRLAQDVPKVWDLAKPERRRQLVWEMFESITISEGRIVRVKPMAHVAPLLALRVRNSGPDRIRTGDLVLDRDVC
jgi:DNA invertase Pin-like site-specific DNA recombinase